MRTGLAICGIVALAGVLLMQGLLLHQTRECVDALGEVAAALKGTPAEKAAVKPGAPQVPAVSAPESVSSIYCRSASESQESDAANQRVQTALRKTFPQVELVGIDFQDAIEYVREQLGVSVYVNWGLLEQEKDDIRTQRVTVRVSGIAASTLLEMILSEGGGGELDLGYSVEDGVLEIATRERLNERMVNRTYYVKPILDYLVRTSDRPDPLPAPIPPLESETERGGIFEDTEDGEYVRMTPREEMMENLTKLIMETVDRDSWVMNGGTATCSAMGETIVIGQTPLNHRHVRSLLDSLLGQTRPSTQP